MTDPGPQPDLTRDHLEVSVSFDPDQSLLHAGVIDPPVRPGLVGTLDRFELLKRVGAGGMGVVYLARDSASGRRVAIKVLKPDFIDHAPTVQHFLREARLMQALSHPNILPIIEVSDRPSGPYFAMPLVESGSLASRIRADGPLDGGTAIDVARQVAEALDYCHKRGIIHRDIKPANVLLDHDGRAYLCDLGLGQSLTDVSITYVQQDKRVGTSAYMAPEIVRGDAGDFRCDTYSFGATLYEMLTGQPPYSGQTVPEVFAKIQARPPEPILSVNPKADGRLARIAEGAMARELRDRYASMADVLTDLERARAGRLVLGPRGTWKPRAISVRRIGLAAVGVCTLATLIFLAYVVLSGSGKGTSGIIIDDAFGGNVLDDKTWTWGQTNAFSYQGTGRHKHSVAQEDGSLLIEASASQTGGWTAIQDVWVDSRADLRKADGHVHLEIEFAGNTVRGNLLVMVSRGEPPTSRSDPDSVRLFEALGDHNNPLMLDRRTLQVDISKSAGLAIVREQGKPSGEFQFADISKLPSWKLRLYVSAGTSAGFPPDVARLRVFRVRANSVAPATGVIGKVMDAMTNRPSAGVTVRAGTSGPGTQTNALGLFRLHVPAGIAQLSATAEDYEQISGPATASVEAGRQTIATILLRRTRFHYGDVSWAMPFEYTSLNGLAADDDWLFFVASEGGAMSLFRMEHNGLSRTKIAPLIIGRGLAFVKGELWGMDCWPGRLYKVELDGRSSNIRRIPLDWPRGLAFDGNCLWFLETSGSDNRYGVYAIDPETGEQKTHLSCGDSRIAGIAIEPAEDGGRLWVSSLAGQVYEVDPVRAGKTGKLEDGIVRKFPGWYDLLCYHQGELWGVDNTARRICVINVKKP